MTDDSESMCSVRIEMWDEDAKCSRMLNGTLRVPDEWREKMPRMYMTDILIGEAVPLPPGCRWSKEGEL